MRGLAIILSVLVLIYLTAGLFDSDAEVIAAKGLSPVSVFSPLAKNPSLLSIESAWLIKPGKRGGSSSNKKSKPLLPAKPPAKPEEKNVRILNIAGVDYQLLGIFKRDKRPFVLLKSAKSPVKKVTQGDEVITGVVLSHVSSDRIILTQSGKETIFKLFELTKNS